ncbi:hypothetical protein AXG93_3384s1830 [Marchantia polymorpha subsp. ruderalis]|uniref:Uncharacterized protein n=1 Tax=Marchantia polymorpha subsp. ruderalis TaxID=1480154 RepID=A0A176WF47_MARPO|nr:hypothetical protein AXG93_3384s1830 [Marchantia polymorpha subsp. ruderalis]
MTTMMKMKQKKKMKKKKKMMMMMKSDQTTDRWKAALQACLCTGAVRGSRARFEKDGSGSGEGTEWGQGQKKRLRPKESKPEEGAGSHKGAESGPGMRTDWSRGTKNDVYYNCKRDRRCSVGPVVREV